MFRLLAISLAALTAVSAFADPDGMLGTKGDSISALQGPSGAGGGSLLQMIIAVVVVFALMKFLLPKLVAKFGGKLSTNIGSSIKIEESASFGGGTLYLVSVKDKSLLLGVNGTTISTLADLGPVNKPDPGPTFMEYLDHTDGANAVVTVLAEEHEEMTEPKAEEVVEDDAQLVLERLQKLMR